MIMEKLKISLLLKETGAFILTYCEGFLYTKEGYPVKDGDKQRLFAKILDEFEKKEKMFEFLSNARVHLNSSKPSVGFFVKETGDDTIQIARLYFIIGISMSIAPMENINYQKFFDEFIDLEGRKIVVENPSKKEPPDSECPFCHSEKTEPKGNGNYHCKNCGCDFGTDKQTEAEPNIPVPDSQIA